MVKRISVILALIVWSASLSAQIYKCDIEQVNKTGKWPVEVLRPISKGFTDVEFNNGILDWTRVPANVFTLTPIEAAKVYYCVGDARIGHLSLKDKSDFTIKNLNFLTTVLYGCKRFRVEANRGGFNTPTYGIRIGMGCEDGLVTGNQLERTEVTTDADAVAVLFSNGYRQLPDGTWLYTPNRRVQVLDNVIRNWTDACQAANSDANFPPWKLFGENPGCSFSKNDCTIDKRFRRPDGRYPPWAEQVGVDLKTGGTKDEPFVVDGNTFWGGVVSDRNPEGYANCIHNQATWVRFTNNKTLGSPMGISLAPPRAYEPFNAGTFERFLYFEGNFWDVGTAINSRDTATFVRDTFRCEVLESNTVMPYRQPREFRDCIFQIGPK